jgi:hypothetical protein
MAKNNTQEKTYVSCLHCAHAQFMRWFNNPIIAYCFEEHTRTVAESQRICSLFKPSGNPNPEITHFDHYEEGQFESIIDDVIPDS